MTKKQLKTKLNKIQGQLSDYLWDNTRDADWRIDEQILNIIERLQEVKNDIETYELLER